MEKREKTETKEKAENKPYLSPYEAYPFLSDAPRDLRCDFELLTDEIASLTGLLCSKMNEKSALREELLRIDTLVYHANPTLRTRMTVTKEEVEWLCDRTKALQEQAREDVRRFVLPSGCETACLAHVLRVKAKELVRLLHRYVWQGGEAPELLFDFCNLLSGYFFGVALLENRENGTGEIDFVSRNY